MTFKAVSSRFCKIASAVTPVAIFWASGSLGLADVQPSYLQDKDKGFALARKILQDAAASASKIKSSQYRDYDLPTIAVSQGRAGDFSGALRSAAKITDLRSRALAMADIAFDQSKQSQSDAMNTFQRAIAIATSLPDSYNQAITLGQIAELQAKSQTGDAISTFTTAVQIATALPKDEYESKASALFYIGASQLNSGSLGAVETFKEASRALSDVQDNHKKWITAFQLAPFQVRAGDDQSALTTARSCTDEKDFKFRSTLLRSVVGAQASKGDIEGALKTTSEIENETLREEALGAVIGAYLKKGDVQEAIRLTDTIQKDWKTKTHALLLIAEAHAKTGDSDKAEQNIQLAGNLFEKGEADSPIEVRWGGFLFVNKLLEMDRLKEATKAALAIKLPAIKVQALSKVAISVAQKGDTVTAQRLLEQAVEEKGITGFPLSQIAEAYAQIGDVPTALKTASRIPREFDRSFALERIAAIQTQNGKVKEAVQWAKSLKSPYLKSSALLGVGLGILQKFGIERGRTV